MASFAVREGQAIALHLRHYVGSTNLDCMYRQEAILHVDSIRRFVGLEGESEIDYTSDDPIEIYLTFIAITVDWRMQREFTSVL